MLQVLLYPLVITALWYLGARAVVTEFIWSRYPARLTQLMDCPACVGFWWGMLISLFGRAGHIDALALPWSSWATPVVVGLCSIVTTPIIAGWMQHGLDTIGHVSPEE